MSQKTAEDLKEYLEQNGVTYGQLGSKVGYSKSAIARFIKGDFDNPDIEGKIKDFLEERKFQESNWEFIDTRSAKMIAEICNQCYECADLGVIYGNAGFGKTTALTRYANQNRGYAVYVKSYVTAKGRVLMNLIKEALGLPQVGYKPVHTAMREIINFLCLNHRLLIIDEADLLNVKSLEVLRAIYDDSQCGMILAGLPRLLMNLTVGPQAKENLAQLYSRVGIQVQIPNISFDELNHILKSYKIKDKEVIDAVYKRVEVAGMRKLAKILTRATRLAEINKTKITKKLIEKAEGLLI